MSYGAPAFVDFVDNLNVPAITAAPDAIPLANGGFAVAGEFGGATRVVIYNASGSVVRTIGGLSGTDPSIAQLDNGNIVVTTESGGSVSFTIVDPQTGSTVVASHPLQEANSLDADVTPLTGNGGFAVAYRLPFSPTDSDLYIETFSATGQPLSTFITVDATVLDDTGISIATLDNGNLAVAWMRTDTNGSTQVLYAVFNPATGETVVPQTAISSNDPDINRNPSISAADGGFAIAYETRLAPNFTVPSSVDIFVKIYDFDGVQQSGTVLTNTLLFQGGDDDGSNDSDPHIARAPDGNLVVSYTTETNGVQFDVIKDGSSITSNIVGGTSSAVTFFGTGQVAVFSIDGGALSGQHLAGSRDGSGDDAGDLAFGDDFFDIMNGGGGSDTLSGGRNDDEVKGDDGADLLHGDDGNDIVNGGGDTGDDTGADTLFGDAGKDLLLGAGGNDTLNGGTGNDTLNGEAGIDTMLGDTGDDTYHVNNSNDVVVETTAGPAGGVDTVNSTATFTLGDNVENLNLLGSGKRDGTGNGANNKLFGNDGGNVLQGLVGNDSLSGGNGDDDLRGGTGIDRMDGGNGKDRYFVDDSNDKTIESNADLATGGIDTVFSTVNRTLGANLENLRLQGADDLDGNGNTQNNKLFGNTGANTLKGLAGNDTLDGKGGADTLDGGEGSDTLIGGGGADVFRFATSNAGVDRILDFSKNFDRFDLGGGTFTALSTAPNGDAILTNNGGAIRIASPPSLTLAQWNALVLPASGKAVQDGVAHGLAVADLAPDASHSEAFAFRHGDWTFA